MNKKPELLKLNLQHFSTPNDPPADPPADPPKKIELTDEELQKKIESESDRKLASALTKKQAEWDQQTDAKIQAAIDEQKRLSTLSADEAQNEKLKQWEADLAEQQDHINKANMLTEARKDLHDKELPEQFAEMLIADDAATTLANIKEFQTNFEDAVNEAVKEKVRQVTPPAGGSSGKASVAQDFIDARNKAKNDTNKAPDPWASSN